MRECTAFQGSLVYCRPPWASQLAVLLLHHHSAQLSRFSLLQRRRFFCCFSNRPMALGLVRDDPLAGAPALDAQFTEGERASAPMEKGTDGFWAGPFGCPEPSFFAVLGLPAKALDGGIPECDCVLVFLLSQVRQSVSFPPLSRCKRMLCGSCVISSEMDPHGHSQKPGTSPLLYWKACGAPLGSLFSTRWMVAGLTECDHVGPPVEKALTALVLAPFGCPEPFCLIDSAELRLADCEKYTTGVRLDIFLRTSCSVLLLLVVSLILHVGRSMELSSF